MTLPRAHFILLGLLSLSIVTTISEYMLAPVLPYLAHFFGTTGQYVSFAISLPTIAFGTGLLVYGPLLDYFGCKKVLMIGVVLFIVFTFMCALATSIQALIFARVLQGFTSAVEGVIVLAMISDMFDEERGIKIMGFYWVIVAIASATSPILGNSINNAFGWHYIFIFLAVVSILSAVALWRYIPDAPSKIHHSGNTSAASHVNKMLIQYKCILSIPAFIIYSAYGSIFFAVLSAFLVGAPFVMIDYFVLSSDDYSIAQSVVILAYVIGSIVAGIFATTKNTRQWLLAGNIIAALGCSLSLYLLWIQNLQPVDFIACCCLIMMGVGINYAIVPVKGIKAVPVEYSGTASALFGAMQVIAGASSALVVGTYYQQDASILLYTMAVCILMAAITLGCNMRFFASFHSALISSP